MQRDIDLPTGRRVLDGVVQQVAQQDAQRFRLRPHGQRLCPIARCRFWRERGWRQTDIHVFRTGLQQDIGYGQRHHGLQLDLTRTAAGLTCVGFFAGQQQQLFNQLNGPVYALVQAPRGGPPRDARALWAPANA